MLFSDRLSNLLANFLYRKGFIEEEHIQYYAYIYNWGIDLFLFFVNLLLIGILIHKIIPSIIFCITVSLLRIVSGGTHASSRIICSCISYLYYFVVMILYTHIPSSFVKAFMPAYAVFLVLIVFLSPVDTPNKRFSYSQKKLLKTISAGLCSLIAIATFFLIKMEKYEYCTIFVLCVIISSTDLCIGYIKNKRGNTI